jgi:hypothetical protein
LNPLATLSSWHQRFGHLGYSSIARMQKENLVAGMGDFFANKPDGVCDVCVQSKAKSLPFQRSLYQAEQPLDSLHVDLMGPFPYMTRDGFRYVLAVLDDHSRMSAVMMLRKKSEATEALITHIRQWESVLGKNLRAFRSDNGSEFRNQTFDSFCDDNGIVRNFSVPRRPQQNGRVERLNGVLVERTIALLVGCDLGPVFWPEAIQYANFLRNRSPFTGSTTPYESFLRRRPNVSDVKVFGCVTWVKVDSMDRSKFDPKAKKGRFEGFAEGVKGFRVMFPDGKIVVSRDCIFDELTTFHADSKPNWERTTRGGESSQNERSAEAIHELARLLAGGIDSVDTDQVLPSNSDSHLDPATPFYALSVASKHCLDNPSSYQQAMHSRSAALWKQAMDVEYDSILAHNVWELCELPSSRKALPTIWVYDLKRDSQGHVIRHKARLVVDGRKQIQGIDYDRVFAPTSHMATVRVLLTVAAHHDYDVYQVDVKTAFLNGIITEEIYVQHPMGYTRPGDKRVCRLLKSLHGLKQAARA